MMTRPNRRLLRPVTQRPMNKPHPPQVSPFVAALPNAISLARLIGALPVGLLVAAGQAAAALVLLTVLIASDWLDGYLARRLGIVSRTGTWLDPLADKVLVLGLFLFFAVWAALSPLLSAWFLLPVGLITAREVYMIVLRSRAADQGQAVPASMVAKVKTTVQFAALYGMVPGFLALRDAAGQAGSGRLHDGLLSLAMTAAYQPLLLTLVWVAAGLTLWSVVGYVRQALSARRNG